MHFERDLFDKTVTVGRNDRDFVKVNIVLRFDELSALHALQRSNMLDHVALDNLCAHESPCIQVL